MDKETIALIIAQNGLGTAATILTVKVAKLEKTLAKTTDAEQIMSLTKKIASTKNLATALRIANDGITQYQAETAA